MFTDKEEAKYSYSLFKRLDMWLCRIMKNIEEYLATHKLLVFTFSLSVFNFLCYSISEDYSSKGNVKFYWIIALAVLVGIMIGSKAINTPYIKTERLHEKIIESKQPYWFEKKWIKIASSCCGIISLVISLIILFVYCPKTNLGFDYLGAIIAIVSLAVAIFVAVQIYQSFNLKRDIDEQNKKLLDESKGVFKEVKKDYQHQIELIKNENKKIEQDYQELKKSLEYTQSDMTFTSIINYAQKMYNGNFIQYAIDGYMDALNVAIKDGLSSDRRMAAINSLYNIFTEYKDALKRKCPVLPDKRNFYYGVLSMIENKDETTRSLETLLLENTEDRDEEFPQGHIRIMSDYNPDLLNAKPNNKPIVEK